VGYIVAGVGLVGVGVGTFLGVSAKGQETDARAKCNDPKPIIGVECPESARSDFDSATSKAKLANVFIIGGSVLAAGGLVMVLVGGPSHPESASLSLSPVLGPRDAGLFASGRF
jgi:serine/threonine-protein kinase